MTSRPLPLLAAAIALCTPAAHASAQDAVDRAAVFSTVQKVFDAMRTRDTALLTQAFDSTARLVGISRRGIPAVTLTSPAQFGAALSRAPAGDVDSRRTTGCTHTDFP